MGRAKHNLDALIFPDHGSGLLELMEKQLRQAECFDDRRIILPRLGAHHAAGRGVGIFMGFDAAEPVHQVFRYHQKVCHAAEPSAELVRIELIDGVEGLKLNAGTAIEFCKRDFVVHLKSQRLRAAVTVGIAGINRFIPLHEYVIHAPGIYGEAFDFSESLPRFLDTRLNMRFKRVDVPCQMSVQLGNAVGKTVHLFCFQLSVFCPPDNMAS